jgi:hypothetical protein
LQRPRLRPGEYPDYLFQEPHPAPVIETREDFREKYLFGDWLGARPELAAVGIKPLVRGGIARDLRSAVAEG